MDYAVRGDDVALDQQMAGLRSGLGERGRGRDSEQNGEKEEAAHGVVMMP